MKPNEHKEAQDIRYKPQREIDHRDVKMDTQKQNKHTKRSNISTKIWNNHTKNQQLQRDVKMTTVEKAEQQQRHTKWPQKEAKRGTGMQNYDLSGKTVSKRDTRWPQRETKFSKTSIEKCRSKTSEQGSIVSQLVH